MTLEQEAEENYPLLDSSWCRTGAVEEENLQLLGHRKSFIAGANSKWVQAEKIKAQLQILKSIPENDGETALWHIAMKQVKLEQQLKQLEDEE